MNLTELFRASLKELRTIDCTFAVGGGFAADLYRKQLRGTSDIDYLFLTDGPVAQTGKGLLEKLNLGTGELKLHQLSRTPAMNKKSQEVYILVGRKTNEEPGIDLLLPPFPWFHKALMRAQSHMVDFGFGPTPTITAEDVILAKLFANRPKDIDDIISIFESDHTLDLAYLIGEMERLKLGLPEVTVSVAPKALRVFSKRINKEKKPFPGS
jgi:hypothetical protein